MKKLLAIVFIGIFVGPLSAFATSLFDSGPAVKQSFQQAATAKPKSKALPMTKVKAIMAAAKREVRQHRVLTQATVTRNSEAADGAQTVAGGVAPKAAAHNQASELKAQLSQINQANILFQQQTDQRFEQLATKNTALKGELARMTQALMLLNQEINSLNQQVNKAGIKTELPTQVSLPAKATSELQRIESKYGSALKYVLYAFIVVLLVFIALFIPRRRQIAKLKTDVASSVSAATAILPTNSNDVDDDTRSEFDYMSTREATPAKLDLARAYIEMEDYAGARQVLGQVLTTGDAEQQQQAQQLLSKIPQKP